MKRPSTRAIHDRQPVHGAMVVATRCSLLARRLFLCRLCTVDGARRPDLTCIQSGPLAHCLCLALLLLLLLTHALLEPRQDLAAAETCFTGFSISRLRVVRSSKDVW